MAQPSLPCPIRLGLLFGVLLLTQADRLSAQDTVLDSAASRFVGTTVTVEGFVASVHTSRAGNTFLNFGAPYPNQTFTAVVFRSSASRFRDLAQWQGRRARVTGLVQMYQGEPEIVLTDPSALKQAH